MSDFEWFGGWVFDPESKPVDGVLEAAALEFVFTCRPEFEDFDAAVGALLDLAARPELGGEMLGLPYEYGRVWVARATWFGADPAARAVALRHEFAGMWNELMAWRAAGRPDQTVAI